MAEWPKKTIGDLVLLQRGIDLPDTERKPGLIPIMGSFGITGRHSEAACKGPGVTVGRSGASAGVVCYVEEDFWPLNTCLYVKDFKGNNPRFAYYLLKTFDLASLNSGSAQPSLNRNFVHPVPASFPEPFEQKAIASVLGALDDKIALNRRMNETLERTARAIFKDWFVDFGPTRAKMEGRQAYLAPEIWSLFPDRLDGERKPVGWVSEPLLAHARLISGGTPKTDEPAYWGGTISWASAKDVSQCADSFLVSTERMITERGLNESSTRLIPPFSTAVVARGATTGRCCIFGKEMAMNQTCYALHSEKGLHFWLNCTFKSLVEGIVHAAHGSVFDTITTKTIEGAACLVASCNLMESFEATTSPLFTRILANIEESRTLAATRDLLLPKLMSGEIRVGEAQEIVGEAT
jgi:type I restriction enzyme S subunit